MVWFTRLGVDAFIVVNGRLGSVRTAVYSALHVAPRDVLLYVPLRVGKIRSGKCLIPTSNDRKVQVNFFNSVN